MALFRVVGNDSVIKLNPKAFRSITDMRDEDRVNDMVRTVLSEPSPRVRLTLTDRTARDGTPLFNLDYEGNVPLPEAELILSALSRSRLLDPEAPMRLRLDPSEYPGGESCHLLWHKGKVATYCWGEHLTVSTAEPNTAAVRMPVRFWEKGYPHLMAMSDVDVPIDPKKLSVFSDVVSVRLDPEDGNLVISGVDFVRLQVARETLKQAAYDLGISDTESEMGLTVPHISLVDWSTAFSYEDALGPFEPDFLDSPTTVHADGRVRSECWVSTDNHSSLLAVLDTHLDDIERALWAQYDQEIEAQRDADQDNSQAQASSATLSGPGL